MARKCPHCGARHPTSAQRCPATGLPVAGDPGLVGTTINERYHLVRMLGDGGMGAVFKAADHVLRRFVAIKLLHTSVAGNPSSVQRFEREARAAAAIGHPNIIDILDFGKTDRSPFLVMEYLRGRSLSHAIATDGPFSIDRACRIATHTLTGLAAAHDRGILHRDLKPANLMLIAHLGDRDFVKICDFGFAALLIPLKRVDESDKALTPERTLVGTPAYAAPERLRGDDRRDPRIDVYSVGVLLYEMLSGVRPFDAPTFAELAKKVKHEEPRPIRSHRPDLLPGLEQVIHRALAKQPEQRFKNAEDMAAALVPFGGRFVPDEDPPSDSFTMDLVKIQARATQRLRALREEDANRILAAATVRRQAPVPPAIEPPVIEAPQIARHDSGTKASPPPSMDSGYDISIDVVTVPEDEHAASAETKVHRRSSPPEPPSAPAEPLPRPRLPEPSRSRPLSVPGDDRAYQGGIVLSMLRFVARRFGERALKDVLDGLGEDSRAVFKSGISKDSWVSFRSVRELMRQVDAKLGRDDMYLVLECGRAGAEGAFDLLREIKPPQPPPELLVSEMPKLGPRVMRGIDFQVRRVGRGYGRLELIEQGEPSLHSCVATLGFMDRSLDRFGAAEVEVTLLSCQALGDESCLMDLSWL